MDQRRPMGSLEAAVLDQLWGHPDGATPAVIMDGLDSDLAYTTVMTVLTRLWEKGLAHRERQGRAYLYRAAVSEAELIAQRMSAALDRANDHRATLSRFVVGLSKKDERLLRRILQDPAR
jgi:predicted transcriptional regulator